MTRLSPLLLAFTFLVGCPREASDPPFTMSPACTVDADCGRLLDAGCNDLFACVVGRCELVPSRVQRCDG